MFFYLEAASLRLIAKGYVVLDSGVLNFITSYGKISHVTIM